MRTDQLLAAALGGLVLMGALALMVAYRSMRLADRLRGDVMRSYLTMARTMERIDNARRPEVRTLPHLPAADVPTQPYLLPVPSLEGTRRPRHTPRSGS